MRHIFHVVVSLAMWCLFGYYWHIVLGREVGPDTVRALMILGLTVVAGLIATLGWVGHNIRLAKRFDGRRQATPHPDGPGLTHDTIGREIDHPGLDHLCGARVIDITADDTTKTYGVAASEGSV